MPPALSSLRELPAGADPIALRAELGVSGDFSPAVLKKAHRTLALAHHPDRVRVDVGGEGRGPHVRGREREGEDHGVTLPTTNSPVL